MINYLYLESVQVVNNLSQSSDNIGQVVEVIRGIAEQTNLLALSAAMEEMKEVLSVARTTNDVTKAEESVRNAERIAQQVLGAPEPVIMEVDTMAIDSVVVDSLEE